MGKEDSEHDIAKYYRGKRLHAKRQFYSKSETPVKVFDAFEPGFILQPQP